MRRSCYILIAGLAFVGLRPQAKAQIPVNAINLGAAGSYATLGPTVTFTGADTINGNIGGATIVGSPTVLIGTNQLDDSLTLSAQSAVYSAYSFASTASYSGTTDYGAVDLGGQTLTPGVYNFSSTLAITSAPLTLDGAGVYIFQIGTTLTTAANIVLEGGAQASDIFWVVGTATLGADTQFAGTVLADTSITADTGVTVDGGLFAISGAVTLSGGDSVASAVPEPAVTSLLVAGLAGLVIGFQRIWRHYSNKKLDLRS